MEKVALHVDQIEITKNNEGTIPISVDQKKFKTFTFLKETWLIPGSELWVLGVS